MPSVKPPKIRALIIDDSQTIRIAASRIFGKEFDVLLAVDGEDGLDVLENDSKIQVVFTDLFMPEMDGFELLKAMRSHPNNHINSLPVIVMTGAENPEQAKEKAFSIGATDFITKPFDATDIRARAKSYAQLNMTTQNLREQTTLDDLTGLLNQRGLDAQIEKELSFVSRHQYPFSIMAIELDNHRGLFTSVGKTSIDKIIKSIGHTLKNSLRKEDTIARTGLARFSVSMPMVEKQNALEMANKICQVIESYKATLNGKRLPLTVSAGIISSEPNDFNSVKKLTPSLFNKLANKALGKAAHIGPSQLFLLSMSEHLDSDLNGQSLSIDTLLEKVERGDDIIIADQLDDVLHRLAPLLALLSNEQKQRILTYR